jgi:hypothetical protein
MQHDQLNTVFHQLPLEAFSLYRQGSVKGAHWVDLCVRQGIYTPLTGVLGYTIPLRIRQLTDARENVNNSLFFHHYMLFVNIISVNLPT